MKAVKRAVLEKLDKLGIPIGAHQLVMSGTHTHSATAGYFDYFVFELTSFGHVAEATDAITRGVVESIIQARNDATAKSGEQKARKLWTSTEQLFGANTNRSPASYGTDFRKKVFSCIYDAK